MNNKKRLYTVIGIILVIVLIILSNYLSRQEKTPTIITTPVIPSITEVPYNPENSFPDVTPEKQPKITIDWSRAVINNPNKQYFVYNAKKLLTLELATEIASKLNFTTANKKNLSNNNVIWKSDDQNKILLFTPKEGTLTYQNLIKPQDDPEFSETGAADKTNEILKSLLPNYQFRISSISYYKDRFYSDEVPRLLADLAQVSVDQTQDSFSIIPSNLTSSHTVILFLNKDLSIKTITINNGFSKTDNLNIAKTFDIEKLKLISPDTLISLTPLKLDRQDQYNQGSRALYTVDKVEPAFVNINNSLSPVYLLSGKLKVDNFAPFPENVQYIAPMN